MPTMQQKRGTASRWTETNPILLAGEIGVETDTNKLKIGDGTTHWNNLDYMKVDEKLISSAPKEVQAVLEKLIWGPPRGSVSNIKNPGKAIGWRVPSIWSPS